MKLKDLIIERLFRDDNLCWSVGEKMTIRDCVHGIFRNPEGDAFAMMIIPAMMQECPSSLAVGALVDIDVKVSYVTTLSCARYKWQPVMLCNEITVRATPIEQNDGV